MVRADSDKTKQAVQDVNIIKMACAEVVKTYLEEVEKTFRKNINRICSQLSAGCLKWE